MSLLLASAGSSATVFTYEGAGGLTFGGAADVARTFTTTASGGLTLAGTAPISTTVVPLQSGGAAFGGSAATEFVSASTSGSSGGGGGWISRTVGRAFSRATAVPAAKVFSYAPSGGLRLGGSAPTSFTSSPRLRREEEEIVLLMALMG